LEDFNRLDPRLISIERGWKAEMMRPARDILNAALGEDERPRVTAIGAAKIVAGLTPAAYRELPIETRRVIGDLVDRDRKVTAPKLSERQSVKPSDCRHPVGQRIDNTCMVCGAKLAKVAR